MPPIISVNDIGKKYRLNGAGPVHDTLRDLLASMISRKRPELATEAHQASSREFWALKDVSFDVAEGEVVGIVGRNGAGKSTLLKILSRITTPTTGEAILNGRVGSLLEVGTGFHPELTGRENVYFNGTILGLRKHEIKARFDEIVAFSGIEAFIDMPIKRYSSGMKMRLAFSVAAHLEPEIMIIDEVLAVGDVDFQTKCLGKMRDVASAGRTVLFVSHNMNAVMQLCSRAIWIDSGTVREDSHDVFAVCQSLSGLVQYNAILSELRNQYFALKSMTAETCGAAGISGGFPRNEEIAVSLIIDIEKIDPALNFGISVSDNYGNTIFWTSTTDGRTESWPRLTFGQNVLRVVIPPNLLNEGVYVFEFYSALQYQTWLVEPGTQKAAIKIAVVGPVSESPYWQSARPGPLAPVLTWKNVQEEMR